MQALPLSDRLARAFASNPTRENRDRAALATSPLIRSIISRINVPDHPLAHPDELFQVGMIAVLQSLDQYDSSMDVRFSSFAYVRIRGAIIDFLRRLDPLPRRRRARVARAIRTCDVISQRDLEEPDDERLAEAMDLDVRQVREIRSDFLRRVRVSLSSPLSSEGEGRLRDVLIADAGEPLQETFENRDLRRYLLVLKDVLTPREQSVLELYYEEGLKQATIAELLDVSEARISQIRKAALRRLSERAEPALRTAA